MATGPNVAHARLFLSADHCMLVVMPNHTSVPRL